MRKALVTMAVAVALVAPATVAYPADSGGLGIRLTEVPKGRAEDPRAQTYVIDHVAPGTTISRKLQVTDATNEPLTAELYAGAADVIDGRFAPSPDRTENELSSWITVTPSSVDLKPRETRVFVAKIAVPADAASGERYAAIWAALPAERTGAARTVNRVGVRIYLSVGPGGEPASDFIVDSLQAAREGPIPVVTATVRNTGGRALDMRGDLTMADGPGGLSAGPFSAELGTTLAPGDTGPVRVELDAALPHGPWTATLTLKSGLLERTAQATITFPDQGEAAPVDAELVDDSAPPWLWIGLGAGLLLAFVLLLVFLLKRRSRSDEHEEKTSVAVIPPA